MGEGNARATSSTAPATTTHLFHDGTAATCDGGTPRIADEDGHREEKSTEGGLEGKGAFCPNYSERAHQPCGADPEFTHAGTTHAAQDRPPDERLYPTGQHDEDQSDPGDQKVVDRPVRQKARRPQGSYDENPRKRKQRRTREPGQVAVHLDRQGGHAGPLKYLIKLGPRVVQRAEEIGRASGSTQSAVFDDMG